MDPSSRRQVLLREFDEVIAPQKAQLAGKLQDAFRCYAPPSGLPTQPARVPGVVGAAPGAVPGAGVPAAGGGGALARSKRPGEGGGGSSKRLRPGPPMDENARRLDEFLKEVKMIINRKLWGKKEMSAFKEPVDPVKLNIPDYHTIIKHPMDVGTVRKKLDTGQYSSPLEVRDDLRLVWRNCATYNPPGHSVRIAGDVLAVAFEAAWAESKMEERWNEYMMQRDPKGLALPHRVGMLSGQVRSTVQGVPSGEPDPSQQMSDIDKRKLSVELSELQGDQLSGVLEILQADMAGATDKEELELDMDTLPNATLWRLHSYVRSVTRRALPQAAPNKTAPQAVEAPSAAGASGAPDATHAAPATAPANGGEQPASHPTVAEKAPLSTSKREGEQDGDMAEAEGSQGSDSKSDSQQEFKGSTMDDPSAQNAPSFPKDRRVVDESATGAGEQSTILKEKAGSRKPEVQVNAANWNASALQQPEGAENEENEEADDEVWKQFQTMDEQKRKQAEDQKKLKEQQEQEMLKVKEAEQEAARKQQQEAEERERKLKEEEERIAQEQQRARMEQCDKEVDEIKARQGTANLTQQNDMQSALMQQSGGNGGLAAVGLVYKNEDEDINFDDDA